MSEEFFIQNTDQVEGGVEIPDDVFNAVLVVADNIEAIKTIAASIDDNGNITVGAVDGNLATIQIRRGTAVDMDDGDPVLALGEFGYPYDLVDPPVLKIGDGVTQWTLLPNILVASDITTDFLNFILAECQAAQTAAEAAADDFGTSAGQAAVSSVAAASSAQEASDWAVAPVSTVLPGGKFSAEVNADRAATTAATSRQIVRGVCTASEDFVAGMLYTKRRYTGSSNIIVTLFPNTFTNVNDVEAWAVYRKGGTGTIQFVGSSTGSGLQAPTVKGSGRLNYRNLSPGVTVSVSQTYAMAIPATTAGKLVMVIKGASPDSSIKTTTLSLSGGLTVTQKVAQTHFFQNVSDVTVWEADLTAFAAATITASVTYGPNVLHIEFMWVAIEGHGGPGVFPAPIASTPVAASVSQVITAVPAQALLIATSDQAGPSGTTAFLNMGTMGVLSFGISANDPDIAVSNSSSTKNDAWAIASQTVSALGGVTVTANYNIAQSHPILCCFYYPPKSVVGTGLVTINKMGARDTLTVDHGEAVLLFHPDGTTVTLLTPSA